MLGIRLGRGDKIRRQTKSEVMATGYRRCREDHVHADVAPRVNVYTLVVVYSYFISYS